MSAGNENPNLRDGALARLLSDALAQGVASDSLCPDPGTVAAYVQRGLSPEETTQWESHFASCGRCQDILADMVRTIDLEPRVADRPTLIPISRPAPPRRAAHWRWLVPALGAAAAIAIWFALRPAPPAPTLEARLSQKDVPAIQPSETHPNPAPTSRATPRLATPPTPAAAPQLPPAANAPQAPPESAADSLKKAESTPPAPPVGGDVSGAQQTLQAEAAPAAQPPENGTPAKAAPQFATGTPGSVAGSGAGRTFSPATRALALAAPQSPLIFASPARDAMWRLEPAGRVQRSTDSGKTWQDQDTGVTTLLAAGAATSIDAAWIVGRAGVILRTSDGGAHWLRVSPPTDPGNSAVLDLVAVTASDGSHATVTASNGRHFVTADGGQTWMAQ